MQPHGPKTALVALPVSPIAQLERAVAAFPTDISLRVELGFLLLEAERWSASRAVFLSVLRQQPKSFAANLGLAKIARYANDHVNSLDLSRQAAAIDPSEIGVRIDIAFDLLRLHRFDEAEIWFTDVLERAPAHVGALVGLGHLARRRGNRTEALSHFMAALTADPTHVEAMLETAGELTNLGRVEAALPLVEAALRVRPEDLNALMQRGHLARAIGDRVLAETCFAHARVAHPDFSPAAVALAEEQRALGRPDVATRILREVLAKDPNNLDALLSLADQAWLAQDYDRCLTFSHRAAQAHPHHVAPPLQATRALMEQGRATEALALLEPVGEANGWPTDLISRKAEILMADGAWDAAAGVLDAAARPKEFGLWLHRVRLALTLGLFTQAESLLISPPVRGPIERGFAGLLRGQLAEARWDHTGAREQYASALAGNPNAARAHAELARVSLLLCDLDACRLHTTEALRLDAAVHKLRGQSLNPSSTHVGQIWDEFRIDPPRTATLRDLLELAPEARLTSLLAKVRAAPDDLPVAMLLAISLRQSGHLGRLPAPDLDRAIPSRIIQFWDDAEPPAEIAAMMQGWRAMHPDYEHVCLDLASAGSYLKQNHTPAVVQAFIRCSTAAQKADIFRLAYLAREGGIYIDADDRCLSHVSSVLLEGASLVAWQEHFGTLGNNFLAAGPGHPVLLRALDLAVTAINRGDEDIPWLATGPGLLTRAFAQVVAEAPDLRAGLCGIVVLEQFQVVRLALFHQFSSYKRTAKHWLRSAFGATDPVDPDAD